MSAAKRYHKVFPYSKNWTIGVKRATYLNKSCIMHSDDSMLSVLRHDFA